MLVGQGCDYQPNITLPERTEERYQFRIQFSCAWSCHCIKIGDNVTHPYGDSVRDDWNGIWNRNLLCSNLQGLKFYYSRTFHFHNNGGYVNVTNEVLPIAITFRQFCSTNLIPIVAACPSSFPTTSMISSTLPAIPLFSSTPLPSSTPAITAVQFPTSSTIPHSSTADLSSTITPSPSSTVSAKDFSSSVAENHSIPQSLLLALSTDTISSSDSNVSTIDVSTPAFHITSTQISVSPTPSVYCPAEQGFWIQTLACEQSRILHCPNISLANG